MSDGVVVTPKGQEIETKKVNIIKLFTDFWFRVPEYQRSYVWGQEEIDELLDDLSHAQLANREKEYFLGSVVLQKYQRTSGDLTYTCYDVLDGQQRLTTLFLMMAVLRDLATNEKLKANASDAIYQEEDPFANQPERIRIEYLIRDAVGDFVDRHIKPTGGSDEEAILREVADQSNVSLSNMAKSMLYLREALGSLTPTELNQFAIYLFNKVIVIYVASESLEDAFRLFTILNDRGIPLSNSDILKSMNVGAVADPNRRRKFAVMWEELEGEFGREEFDRFLGHLRTTVVKEKARENLLKEFEKIYELGLLQKGEATLRKIKSHRDSYASLIWFENEEFGGDCRQRNLIAVMREGLSTDWIPPLLLFVERFNRDELLPFLERLESKVLADWIVQLSPTSRISNTNNILRAIERASSAADVVANGEVFAYDRGAIRAALSGPIYGRNFARYVMLRLEYHLQDRSQPFAPFTRISVEHVLPQNPKEGSRWRAAFGEADREVWTHRLANLVLLSRIKNTELSNREFDEKRKKYFKSSVNIFPNVVKVMQYADWTPQVLEERQEQLLDLLMQGFK